MYLVLRGNKVIDYGENCMNIYGNVFCQDTGNVYSNATIAEFNGTLPTDIESVGYEYHAGVFVPCEPHSIGDGTVAVVGRCGTIFNSGKAFNDLSSCEYGSYRGSGSPLTIYFTNEPNCVIIHSSRGSAVVLVRNINTVSMLINGITYNYNVSWGSNYITISGSTPFYIGDSGYEHVYCAFS